jgi:hypothetical protein
MFVLFLAAFSPASNFPLIPSPCPPFCCTWLRVVAGRVAGRPVEICQKNRLCCGLLRLQRGKPGIRHFVSHFVEHFVAFRAIDSLAWCLMSRRTSPYTSVRLTVGRLSKSLGKTELRTGVRVKRGKGGPGGPLQIPSRGLPRFRLADPRLSAANRAYPCPKLTSIF